MLNGLYKIDGVASSIDGKRLDLRGDFSLRPVSGSNGVLIDVTRHVVAEFDVEQEAAHALATKLRVLEPSKIEEYRPDFTIRPSELMLIAEPHEMPITAAGDALRHADMPTLRFILNYLHLNLQGFQALYLIGSRSSGIRSSGGPVSDKSDHDVIAVISDSAPDDLVFGNPGSSNFFKGFNAGRYTAGLGGIDLITYKSKQIVASTASSLSGKAWAVCLLRVG